MRLGRLAGVIVLCLSAAAGAADDQRRSGYEFMSRETRAMQDDDAANPGMLSVLDGEALWNRAEGPEGKSCASCHGDARSSMKGVAARYPEVDGSIGRPIDLEQRINRCRIDHQHAAALPFESSDLLALTAYVAHQSKGQPITVADDLQTRPFIDFGSRSVSAAPGSAEPVLRQLPRRQFGRQTWRFTDSPGAPDRLPDLPPRMAKSRVAAPPPAQLHDRHARRTLRQ